MEKISKRRGGDWKFSGERHVSGEALQFHTDNAGKVDESRSFQPQELQFSRIR